MAKRNNEHLSIQDALKEFVEWLEGESEVSEIDRNVQSFLA